MCVSLGGFPSVSLSCAQSLVLHAENPGRGRLSQRPVRALVRQVTPGCVGCAGPLQPGFLHKQELGQGGGCLPKSIFCACRVQKFCKRCLLSVSGEGGRQFLTAELAYMEWLKMPQD